MKLLLLYFNILKTTIISIFGYATLTSCTTDRLFKCETELEHVRHKLEVCENQRLIEDISRCGE